MLETQSTSLWHHAEAPEGFLRACEAQINAEDRRRESAPPQRSYLSDFSLSDRERESERLWQETTGVAAAHSRFLLCIPIHNEETLLGECLAALRRSHLPRSVPATFLFIPNACTDKSEEIVSDLFRELGESHEFDVPNSVLTRDSGLSNKGRIAQVGAATYISISSTTPSKANALEVASALAHERKLPTTMSLDANVFIEPDGLRAMFAHAHRCFFDPDSRVSALCSKATFRLSPKHTGPFAAYLRWRGNGNYEFITPHGKLCGGFHAWQTAFVVEHGYPRTKTEDNAFSFLLLAHGREALTVPQINVWGFSAGTLLDSLRLRVRFATGRLQLAAFFRDSGPALDRYLALINFAPDLQTRFDTLVEKLRERRGERLKNLLSFVSHELINLWALRVFNKDPKSSTWSPLKSTK